MSRMFPWERWPTILIGSVYTFLLLLDLTMGAVHVVPSTCGYEFFLPPLPRPSQSTDHLVGWVEVLACRDATLPPVSVTLTVYTASGDVVHTLSVLSNETARVEKGTLLQKQSNIGDTGYRISASQKVSAYAHDRHNGSDVMTLIPFDALSTSYLIPDLRTSGSEEQHVVFYNVFSRTNVTVTKNVFSGKSENAEVSNNETKRNTTTSSSNSNSGKEYGDVGPLEKSGNTSVKNDGGGEVSTTTLTANISEDNTSSSSTSPMSSASTTTVKATPTSLDVDSKVDSSNKNSDLNSTVSYYTTTNSSSSSSHSTVHPVARSIFFFSSSLQTKSLLLEKDSSFSFRSDKPLGVVVVMVDVAPASATSSPLTTSSSSASSKDGDSASTGEKEEARVRMEMLPPSSTLGKYFYLPLHGTVTDVKLVVSGQENATLEMFWNSDNASHTLRRSLLPSRSLVLGNPGKKVLPQSYVWAVSTSPLLVYVVMEICVGDQERESCESRDVSAFVLPPVEQHFRCVAEVNKNSCDVVCPSFWNSMTCRQSAALNSSEAVDAGTGTSTGVVPGWDIMPRDTIGDRVWQIRSDVNLTSSDTAELCVKANSSYLPFRLGLTSGSFSPAGMRLARLYSACVPSISEQGGDGDGVDNDCDGFIDEEVENMTDDDGDGRIDEDTSSDCENDVTSRKARSGDLQKAVANPAPVWPFADYEQEESEMPLFAVIISLSVAIFAVIAVISVFLLMELMSRRRQIRNPKIRPFVS